MYGQNTGTAFVISGTNNSLQTIRDCQINSFVVGVTDYGVSTTLDDNEFYSNTLPINSNGTDSKYINNRTSSTTGSYSIQHTGGSSGISSQSNLLNSAALHSPAQLHFTKYELSFFILLFLV